MTSRTASTQPTVVCFGTSDHMAMADALQQGATARSLAFEWHDADGADPGQVFARMAAAHRHPTLVVFGAGRWQAGSALDTPPEAWDAAWRSQCLQGARIGQAAIRAMRQGGQGTLIFLGHADGVTDAQPARRCTPTAFGAAHAAASAGLRSLAQSMARGFGPDGLHVAHLCIDGHLPLPPKAAALIAQTCWAWHGQGRSAWSHEVALRVLPEPEDRHPGVHPS